MIDYLVVAFAALAASALTLFSGFGLGTILMPVLALLFPVPVAIAATAIVHLANNLFKLLLVGRHADWSVVARFGSAAGLAAIAGAMTLQYLAELPQVASYELAGRVFVIEPVKLVIGILIVGFAILDFLPAVSRISLPRRYLIAGGLLSGFFGGLSGSQGALRAAFLIHAGLDKNTFVGTSVVCSVIVDTLRIGVYGFTFMSFFQSLTSETSKLIAVATLSAFTGAFLGVRLLRKVTLEFVRLAVATLMLLVGSGLAGGML